MGLFNALSDELLDFDAGGTSPIAEAFSEMALEVITALGLGSRYGSISDDAIHPLKEPGVSDDSVVMAWQELVDGFDLRRQADPEACPVLPPQLLPIVLEIPGLCEKVLELGMQEAFVEGHVKPAHQYGHENLNGYSPFSFEDSFPVAVICSDYLSDLDLDIQLCPLFGEYWSQSLDICFLPARFGIKPRENSESMNKRSAAYSSLARAARAHELDELASAFTSFFVVSQSLRYSGELGPWDQLKDWFINALGLPEREMLVAAFGMAAAHAEQQGQLMMAKRLEGVLHIAGNTDCSLTEAGGPNPFIGLSTPKAVLSKFESMYGADLVALLSNKTRRYLGDVQVKVERLRGDQATGNITEWGGQGEDLFKTIEAELKSRLLDIYEAEEYRKWKRGYTFPEDPNLGNFFHLLNQYRKMPDTLSHLREEIDRRFRIQRLSPLIKRLHKLTKKYRNPGGHTGHPEISNADYPFEKLNETLSELYQSQDGFWELFLDALRPINR